MAGLNLKVTLLLHIILIGVLAEARSANIRLEKDIFTDKKTGETTAKHDDNNPTGSEDHDINSYVPVILTPGDGKDDNKPPENQGQDNLQHKSKAPKAILGKDDRVKVEMINHPFYKSLVYITPDCTGIFVGERHVLTSASCADQITAKTIYHNEELSIDMANPKSSNAFAVKHVIVTNEYKKFKSPEHNFALVITDKRANNHVSLGWIAESGKGTLASVVGYPADKADPSKKYPNDPTKSTYKLFLSLGEITSSSDYELFHDCDVVDKNEGSPIYNTGKKAVYGVHTGYDLLRNKNRGVRITERVYNYLQAMIDTN